VKEHRKLADVVELVDAQLNRMTAR
jgi:hypothetical protein